jgi:hypothetical protein
MTKNYKDRLFIRVSRKKCGAVSVKMDNLHIFASNDENRNICIYIFIKAIIDHEPYFTGE